MTEKQNVNFINKTKNNLNLTFLLMITSSVIVISVAVVLNLFFLEKLTEPKLDQLKLLGKSTTISVSEIAVKSIYNRNTKDLDEALNHIYNDIIKNQKEFLQVSVILLPSGLYFSSTNNILQNKKAHSKLLKIFNDNKSPKINIQKFKQYKISHKSISVIQFLMNISINSNGQDIKVGTTQVLFGYDRIVSETRIQIIIICLLILILLNIAIWLIVRPFNQEIDLITANMIKIGQNQFDLTLPSKKKNEMGIMFSAFNQMSFNLLNYFNNLQNTLASQTPVIENKNRDQLSLRKAEITCLCARIPEIQQKILSESSEDISRSIIEFLETFQETIQEYGGQVIKIFGNRAYTIFEGMNSNDNAIRAAIKINQIWKDINHERKVLRREIYKYGIGLHCADSLAGTFNQIFSSYTVIGVAVSKAEYLCTLSGTEQVLVSSTMLEKTNGSYHHKVIDESVGNLIDTNEEIFSILSLDKTSITDSLDEDNIIQSDLPDALKRNSLNIESDKKRNDSFESSLPDMLEETLNSSPLEFSDEDYKSISKDDDMKDMEKERNSFLNTNEPNKKS